MMHCLLQGTDAPGMQKALYTLSTASYVVRSDSRHINRELNITVVFRL